MSFTTDDIYNLLQSLFVTGSGVVNLQQLNIIQNTPGSHALIVNQTALTGGGVGFYVSSSSDKAVMMEGASNGLYCKSHSDIGVQFESASSGADAAFRLLSANGPGISAPEISALNTQQIYNLLTSGTGVVSLKQLVLNSSDNNAPLSISAAGIAVDIASSGTGVRIESSGGSALYAALQLVGSPSGGPGLSCSGGGTTGPGALFQGGNADTDGDGSGDGTSNGIQATGWGSNNRDIGAREFDLVLAMVNGRFKKDFPSPGNVTFYKQDNTTVLFTMNITDTERTRL